MPDRVRYGTFHYVRDFHSYLAYQHAVRFAVEASKSANSFPINERFALSQQLRRSATSVPSNIAEGSGRHTGTDFVRFLYIAIGSLNEAEAQITIARELDYLDRATASALISKAETTRKLITGLAKSAK